MKKLLLHALCLSLLLSYNINAATTSMKSKKICYKDESQDQPIKKKETKQKQKKSAEPEEDEDEYEEEIVVVKKKKAPKGSLAVTLSDQKDFEKLIKENKLILLAFSSEDCTFCGDCDKILCNISKHDPKIKCIKVDTNKFSSIRKKYEVDSVPTWVFLKDGKEIPDTRLKGNLSSDMIANSVENIFYGSGYKVTTSNVDPRKKSAKNIENKYTEQTEKKSNKSSKSRKLLKNN